MLNVLTMLVELEPQQAQLLDRICAGPLLSEDDLRAAGAFTVEAAAKPQKRKTQRRGALFE